MRSLIVVGEEEEIKNSYREYERTTNDIDDDVDRSTSILLLGSHVCYGFSKMSTREIHVSTCTEEAA